MGELRQHVRTTQSVTIGFTNASRWNANEQLLPTACAWFGQTGAENSASENGDIKTHVLEIANFTKVDPRFILAITMQESRGCARVKTTVGSHDNPGLMQSNQGDNSCFGLQSGQPCSSKTISGMLMDGTSGTVAGDGLASILQDQATQGHFGAQLYYRAARIYNSGSVATDGLLEHGGATHCYASSIANRLTGWVANEGSYCCAWDASGGTCTATPVGGSAAATQLPASIDDGPSAAHIPCAANVAPAQSSTVRSLAMSTVIAYTSTATSAAPTSTTSSAQPVTPSAYSWQATTTSTSTVQPTTPAGYSFSVPALSTSLVSLPRITYLPPPSTRLPSTQSSANGSKNTSYAQSTTTASIVFTVSSSYGYVAAQNTSSTNVEAQSTTLPLTTVSVIPLPVSAYSTAPSANSATASTYTTTIQLTSPATTTVQATLTSHITFTSTVSSSVSISTLDTSFIVWPTATYGSESSSATAAASPQSSSGYDWSNLTSLGGQYTVTVTITRDDCYPTASVTSTTTSTSFATTLMDPTNGPAVNG